MDNPITNNVQAHSVERYIDYLKIRLRLDGISQDELNKINTELNELDGQLDDYNTNTRLRLVVDNTVTA